MSNKYRKIELSDESAAEVGDALDVMESLSHYDASKASVACDRFSSALIDAFLPGKHNPFRGRAPELFEVLETLEEQSNLPAAASAAALEISTALEDAYDLEENEELAEEVKEHADVVVVTLREFLGL